MSDFGYNIDGFCAAVGISRSTFYALQHDGIGPRVTKVGKRLNLIRHEDVTAWLDRRAQGAALDTQPQEAA